MDEFELDECFQNKGRLIDAENQLIEYKELLIDLLNSINTELEDKESKLSKEDILNNLKSYLKEFIKYNKIKLY